MFRFTNDCILGVEQIDNEHRHLFDLINQGMDMLQDDYDMYSEIKELLLELEDYAEEHFAHEEAYMRSICDPELILQRIQHVSFHEQIMEFMVKNIDDNEAQHEVMEEIMTFLAKWLYHHILGSDILIGKLPPLEEWKMMENPCEYLEEYEMGVHLIDCEHKILFETADRLNQLVREWEREHRLDEIMNAVEEFKEHTAAHFKSEEEYMQKIGYDGYESQRLAHESFLARLNEIGFEHIDDDPKQYLESLAEFLIGWIINHIRHMDKQIPAE